LVLRNRKGFSACKRQVAANVTVPSAGAWAHVQQILSQSMTLRVRGRASFFRSAFLENFLPLELSALNKAGAESRPHQVGLSGGELRLRREVLLQEQPRRKLACMII
jgi:hypothetical protein